MIFLWNRKTAWVIALIAVLSSAVMSRLAAARYVRNEADVRHTLAVRAAISDTLSLLKDAETAQRGYALTLNPTFLAPHARAERELEAQLNVLQALTWDDPEQSRSARVIRGLAIEKLAVIAQHIALIRDGKTEEVWERIRQGGGARLMDDLRAESERMAIREAVKLEQREETAARAERHTWTALAAALLVALVVVLGGLISSHRDSAAAALARRRLLDSERAFREQSMRLESILSSMGDGVLVLDQDRRVVMVNPAAQEHVRQQVGQQIPLTSWTRDYRVLSGDGTTPFQPERGPLTRALRGEPCDNVELVLEDLAGKSRVFSVTSRPLQDDGRAVGAVGVYREITTQRSAERALAESERRFRVLSEASFEGIALSRNGRIIDCNETFAAWLGRTPEELVGFEGVQAFAAEDREHVAKSSARFDLAYEARLVRADGSLLPVEIRGRAATFNGETVRVAVVRDVTEKKLHEADLKQQAERLRSLSVRDELTGLYNRRGFLELAGEQLQTAARSARGACLFYADLNDMKKINDGLGHEMGDRALIAAARLLSAVFRDSDVVARLGGDEFAALASDCDALGIASVRERLRDALLQFNAGPAPYELSISLGACLYDACENECGTELESLMMRADAQMYEEKKARKRGYPEFSGRAVSTPPSAAKNSAIS